MYTEQIPLVLILNFLQGKQYNERQVDDWFRNIFKPTKSDINIKNDVPSMLGSFEYSYGKYLSDVADIFRRKYVEDEKEKEKKR
jgi:hypothetical protein